MQQAFGSSPDDIVAGIGPSIGPCCYEVGDEVITEWSARSIRDGGWAVIRRDTSYHFDLWNANRLALIAAGVPRTQIEISGVCVRCAVDRFFSYRASQQGIATPGRMMLIAQLLTRDDTTHERQERA
jgi:copper oxidase (laccase) domain-containing protein